MGTSPRIEYLQFLEVQTSGTFRMWMVPDAKLETVLEKCSVDPTLFSRDTFIRKFGEAEDASHGWDEKYYALNSTLDCMCSNEDVLYFIYIYTDDLANPDRRLETATTAWPPHVTVVRMHYRFVNLSTTASRARDTKEAYR